VTGPASPAGGPPPLAHAEPAMGTVFSFAVVTGTLPPATARAAVAGACEVLHRCDALFSTWEETSPLSRFRRGAATLGQMPPEFHEVLGECRAAQQASAGWFDPWAMPGGFDPTGLVKGWATERALDVLRDAGVTGALINGGGDVAAFGEPTSGCYERGPHLIDPRTGQPASRAASATVTGPRLALADALATGVAAGGDEALPAVARLAGYAAYLIRSDGSETSVGGIEFVRLCLSASLTGRDRYGGMTAQRIWLRRTGIANRRRRRRQSDAGADYR
jgi:thiamine biosynthesis lipoprotein